MEIAAPLSIPTTINGTSPATLTTSLVRARPPSPRRGARRRPEATPG
jgi:hypothetical protein